MADDVKSVGSRTVLLMADNLSVAAESSGPIIVFEIAPSFGHVLGLIDICLVATRIVPGIGSQTVREAAVVANLRCTAAGAISLRDALNGALLMLEPVRHHATGKDKCHNSHPNKPNGLNSGFCHDFSSVLMEENLQAGIPVMF